jgi:two-component system sensor histidine kinase QseC
MSPISEGRLKIEGEASSVVIANHHDLEHLLQNLVTNALKYSPKDRDVLLNFKEDELTIQDFGPGIPKEVLEKIGSPFNTGAHRSERATGLGLAWVHAIANKYDWQVQFVTTPEGTKIHIHF